MIQHETRRDCEMGSKTHWPTSITICLTFGLSHMTFKSLRITHDTQLYWLCIDLNHLPIYLYHNFVSLQTQHTNTRLKITTKKFDKFGFCTVFAPLFFYQSIDHSFKSINRLIGFLLFFVFYHQRNYLTNSFVL